MKICIAALLDFLKKSWRHTFVIIKIDIYRHHSLSPCRTSADFLFDESYGAPDGRCARSGVVRLWQQMICAPLKGRVA